jgi:exodeoxyribonuclease-5
MIMQEIPLIGQDNWDAIDYASIEQGLYGITTPDGKVLNEQQVCAVLLMECWYFEITDFFDTPIGFHLLKEVVSSADLTQYKDCQDIRNNYADQWFESDFTLIGFAGTGKTASLQAFLNRAKQRTHLLITATTPTNKALKVLKAFGKSSKITGIEYQTIYQSLGMKLETDDDGKEVAVGDKDGKQNLQDFDLAILDEASMLNASMHSRIVGLSKRPKFIFMGDSKQLKPVNDKTISPVFTNVTASYTLSKVMRYPEGSAIASLVTAVRDNVGSSEWIDPRDYANSEDVIVTDSEDFLDRLVEDLQSDRYLDNPDSVKAICYTNKVVDWINNFCHEKLYGKKADAFVPGERLVSTKPVTRWKPGSGTEVILKNRFEVDVLSVVEDEVEGYKAWQVRASVVDEDRRVRLVIVDPSERKRLNAELDDLRQMALKLPKGSTERKVAWREMYKLRDSFDSVVHSFCITTHGSQGSSFNNVYVAERDLLRCKEPLERSQLKYVAYSRAMERLIISV